jgi:calcineurin-like phosphoesterase family protein
VRFFTADHHFGHANILKYTERPWDTLEEMHEELIGRWNNVVGLEDTVVILGDFSYKGHDALDDVVPRLNGRKILVCGNHDLPWIGNVKTDPIYGNWVQSSVEKVQRDLLRYMDLGIDVMSQGAPIDVLFNDLLAGEVHAHHFPYEVDDRHGSRFARFQMEDDGGWLLHGHVHEAWKVRGRQINVGVDVHPNYAPFSEDEILAIIARGPVLTEEAEVSP